MKKVFFLLLASFVKPSIAASKAALSIPEGVLSGSGLNPHIIAKFSLFIAIVLLWSVLVGKFLKMTIRLPIIAGQIIGGILLGPSCFDIQHFKVFSDSIILSDWASNTFYALASSDIFVLFLMLLSAAFTVPYLLWIAGHETDVKDILKVGVTAVTAGILGAVVPIALTVFIFHYALSWFSLIQAMSFGLVLSATSVSIPIAMFFAQNKMHLKTSKATLGAAIIDDIAAVIALSIFFICLQSGTFGFVESAGSMHGQVSIVQALLYMVISFAVIFATGYFVIPSMIKVIKKYHHNHLIASVANGAMFLYFAFAELIGGLSGITGAYFAGLFHRIGDKHHHAERIISPFVNTVLLPLFLGSIGLQVDITILTSEQWGVITFLLIVAIFSKLLGCYSSTIFSNALGKRASNRWSLLEGYLFGSSMVARGEVGLVVSTILRGSGLLSHHMYIMAIVVIILTTIASPVMLSIGFYFLDSEKSRKKGYSINIGTFESIGSLQMFNIIMNRIDSLRLLKKSTIRFSEGCKIVNLECQNIKIILDPNKGIIFKGNQMNIESFIGSLKGAIANDMNSISLE